MGLFNCPGEQTTTLTVDLRALNHTRGVQRLEQEARDDCGTVTVGVRQAYAQQKLWASERTHNDISSFVAYQCVASQSIFTSFSRLLFLNHVWYLDAVRLKLSNCIFSCCFLSASAGMLGQRVRCLVRYAGFILFR